MISYDPWANHANRQRERVIRICVKKWTIYMEKCNTLFNIKEVSYIHVSVKTTRDWLTGGARLVVYVAPL